MNSAGFISLPGGHIVPTLFTLASLMSKEGLKEQLWAALLFPFLHCHHFQFKWLADTGVTAARKGVNSSWAGRVSWNATVLLVL